MKQIILIASVLLILVACTSKPIYNVKPSVVVTGSGKTPSLEQVRKAVASAANIKEWTTVDLNDNQMIVTHRTRSHMAQVVVVYSEKSFSIDYKGSEMMRYDGDRIRIHRSYNKWVKKLENAIKRSLDGL